MMFAQQAINIKIGNTRLVCFIVHSTRAIMESVTANLQAMICTADGGNWTFDKVIQKLEMLFNKLRELAEEGANDGNQINEDTKFSHLLHICQVP